jgi:hypothetical protein
MRTEEFMSHRLPLGADHDRIGDLRRASGFSTETIRNAAEAGKLLGFRANGKGGKGEERRFAWSFPRECSVAWLCSIAHFTPDELAAQLAEALEKLPPELLAAVVARATRRYDRPQRDHLAQSLSPKPNAS